MADLALFRNLDFNTVECYSCGCIFAMSADFYTHRVRDKKGWYCPNGHNQHFVGESDVDKANRLLKEEQDRHRRTLERVNEAERERDRLKRRVKAGVCPCCKRTFKQLVAHMKQKHPDFDVEFGKQKLPK